jgi:hypothetical protein
MSMRDWLWKAAGVVSVILLAAFMWVPTPYDAHPVLSIALLASSGVLIVATFIHALLEQRRKKANKDKAISSSSAL